MKKPQILLIQVLLFSALGSINQENVQGSRKCPNRLLTPITNSLKTQFKTADLDRKLEVWSKED